MTNPNLPSQQNYGQWPGDNPLQEVLERLEVLEARAETLSIVNRNTEQAIPNATFTNIIFNNRLFDPLNHVNTGTGVYTAPNSGSYFVTGVVPFGPKAGTLSQIVSILLNGGEDNRGGRGNQSPAGSEWNISATGIITAKAGDKISIAAFQNSGEEMVIPPPFPQMSVIQVA